MIRRTERLTRRDRTGSVVHEIIAIARKELLEFRRQPGVLTLVVLGPFMVLAAFGVGYRNEELALRTVFVGPADSPYENAIDRYTEAIDEYVVPVAFTTDLFAATDDLVDDRIDLIVVLPPNVVAAIDDGRRSEIAVIHDSIDPIERIGIEFAAEVAVRELNATVVTSTLDALLQSASDFDEVGGALTPRLLILEEAIESGEETDIAIAALELRVALDEVEPALQFTIGPQLGAAETSSGQRNTDAVTSISAIADLLDSFAEDPQADDLTEIRTTVRAIDASVARVLSYDADLLARPFSGDAESLVREPVSAEDHVAPGATALLVQHLAVSLAALSLVRDERRGIMDEYRIGPTSVASVLIGKLVALSAVAGVAAGLIVGLQVGILGIPLRGSPLAVIGLLVGLVVAASSLGLLIATVFRSELFASQAAMISLLVALFFSGFLLQLDRITEPIRSLGMLVPATPAVDGLRSVQLRGDSVAIATIVTLGLQAVVALALAATLITRRWRSGS